MSVHGTESRSNQRLRVAFEARWRSRVRDVCVELISKPYLIFLPPPQRVPYTMADGCVLQNLII